jgi:hypothetical protein
MLNTAMSKSLDISIIHTMTDNSQENEPVIYREWNNIINSNNLSFANNIDIYKGYYDDTRYKIFFGDIEKLVNLRSIVATRLDNIKLMTNKSKLFSKENKVDNQDESYSLLHKEGDYRRIKVNLNNPFINKEKKSDLFNHYKERLQGQTQEVEENLKTIYKLLTYRIELNKNISPIFLKPESRQHGQLLQ